MNERLNAIVGAKISEFRKKMAEVRNIAAQFARNDATKDINADTRDFTKDLNAAKAKIATFAATDANKGLNLDTYEYTRKITMAQARATSFVAADATKNINADTSDFNRGVTAAQARARNFSPKTIWVTIKARHKTFRKDMDRIADAFRDINVVGAEMGKGVMGIAVPALATMAAGLTGIAATAGVQAGVLAGGLMGLVSSFGLAGAGAVGFVAAMIPTITRMKEANTAIKNGEATLSQFSSPMQTALKGLWSLQDAYSALNKAIEPYVLRASGTAMSTLGGFLTAIQPGIVNVAKAFEGLMTDLQNVFKNAEDVKASIAWFNKRAGGAVTAWAKIAGYAFRGFVNLMRAFDPLAKSVEGGLLNMTKRFSEWAAGLSKSEKFKAFIEYVKTNGPKLMASIGNIIMSIVNLFAAFAPLGADMMTTFQGLTARFREWTAALGENKQFQAFIQYIRDNGPQMKELLVNVFNVLVQLGQALGRVGEVMLPVINRILSLTAGFLKAHPAAGNILVSLFSMMAAFKVLAPVIATFRLLFGGAISYVWKLFNPFKIGIKTGLKMIGDSAKTAGKVYKSVFTKIGNVIWKVVSSIGNWLRMLVTTFVTTTASILKALGKMIARAAVWAGKMIMNMAKVAAKYAWLGIKALAHAAKVAASWVIAMGPVGWVIATVVALVALIIANWGKVKKWTTQIWSAVASWIKEKWSQITSATKSAAQAVWQWVKDKFNAAKDAISTALNAAWSFIKSIWNSIKTYITDKASAIWSAVKGKFQDIVTAVKDKMNDAWDKVKSIWGDIQSFFEGIDLFDIGADIIQGLINGVGSMAKALWKKASSIAEGIGGAIKGALGIKSPSRVTTVLGEFTGEGLYNGMVNKVRQIKQAAHQMAMAAIPQMSPVSLSLASIDSPSYSRGSMDGLMSGSTTNNDNSTVQQTNYVTISAKDVKEFNDVVDFFGTFKQEAKTM